MKRTITIAYNNLDKSIETKNILVEKLLNSDFEVSEQIEENTELIISIGGDGSFLQTVHKFDFVDIPVIAINTGHLGFFAELSPDKIDTFISAYKNKEYFIQEAETIEANICTEDENIKLDAINEIVIKNRLIS